MARKGWVSNDLAPSSGGLGRSPAVRAGPDLKKKMDISKNHTDSPIYASLLWRSYGLLLENPGVWRVSWKSPEGAFLAFLGLKIAILKPPGSAGDSDGAI